METTQKQVTTEKKKVGRKGFFISLKKNPEIEYQTEKLLRIANSEGERGREITMEDLVLVALQKISEKDIGEIRASTLSSEQKFMIGLKAEYQKHIDNGGEKLDLWDFALKTNQKIEKVAHKVIQ